MSLQDKTQQTVQLVKENPFKTISISSLLAVGAFLVSQGWNPLDTIVQNSGAYQILEEKVEGLEEKTAHGDHVLETQNFVLKKLLDGGAITVEQYTERYHAVDHDDDSEEEVE